MLPLVSNPNTAENGGCVTRTRYVAPAVTFAW